MSKQDELRDRRSKLSSTRMALLQKRLQGEGFRTTSRVRISRRPPGSPPTLSFAQERVWFLDQLEPGNPVLNRPLALRLKGSLNVGALEESLNSIVRRHETLRTSYPDFDGRPFPKVSSSFTPVLSLTNLSDLPKNVRETEARRIARAEAQRSFNLKNDPVLSTTLLRMYDEDHVLLLTTHHITFDAWSASILVDELMTSYEALVRGGRKTQKPLPIQYTDYAHWQRQWLQGETLQKYITYWKESLAGAPQALQMPTDYPRPPIRTYHGAIEQRLLPGALSDALVNFSRQEGATLFMTLFAAFNVLLYRYTGQADIVIGTPIAGRDRIETENLIGLFINILALRTDLSGAPSFRELLMRVKESTLEALSHQELPIEKLVEVLNPERDISRSPLFQVSFNLENIPEKSKADWSLSVEEFNFDRGIVEFDLDVEIARPAEGLKCSLRYNTDLFDRGSMARLLGHYQTLLDGIVAKPDCSLSELPLMTDAERYQILVAWNETRREYPGEYCVHQLFEDQVERTPNDVAVIYESEQLTYQELNQRSNQLAHYLRRQGVGPDVLVGVFMQRSVELIIGLLGVLKAGCAYVTLDLGYPESRLAYMLDDTRIRLVLSQEGLSDKLPEYDGEVLFLDHDRDLYLEESKTNPPIDTTPDNLACVFYTSGSTGNPKGVLIAHRGVVNYLDYLVNRYKIGGDDVVLQLASLSFDPSIRDTIGPLTTGASVVLVNDVDAKDPAALLAQIKEHRVSRLLSIGPMLLNALITSAEDQDLPYSSIRTVLVSGENLYAVDVSNAKAVFGDKALIVNQYGPTEITMIASSYPHGFRKTGKDIDQHTGTTPAYHRDIPNRDPLGKIGPNMNGAEWEMPHWDQGHEVCVHHIFEAQVNQTPEAIAVQFENQQLTYAELNTRANRLAHLLQKLGVKQDVLVGIFIEPSLELLIGVLGILKAGGAYVPLDTLYPPERLAIILSDIRTPVIVTSEQLRARLPDNSAHTVCLDADARILARQNAENPSSQVTTDNLAYVVYTSGSTGAPKGVHTTHRAVTNLLSAVGRRLQVMADDVLLSVTKLIFDIATLELFLPLCVGAKVVVASWETTSDGFLLKEKLSNSGATIMQATPTLWQLLVSVGWQGDGHLKALSGGETLPRLLADELLRRCGSVWNLYGPSETTIYSTAHKVVPDRRTVPIGRPIANTQIYILDEHLQPVPIGVPGELHVGGVGVARGYLNRPQLTTERFIPDIFSRNPGARLYKTGDLARYRPDGNIEFLGRLDYQVKIRGFRVEPGEIEEVLGEHPSVREAVITAIEDESGSNRLIAYMVPNHGQQPSVKEVRGFLKERLPDFMIPSAFVVLDAMPLTPNGKVDRKALPLPEKVRPELESDFVPPRTPVEEKLSAIWADLLGLENIGINDNFFELGGHSLLATRVISRVRDQFQVKIDLRRFFDTEPTISNLAQSIETLQWMAQKECSPPENSTGERDEGDL